MNIVTALGQVTILQPILDILNIGPGGRVEFVVNQGQIVLRSAGPDQSRPHLLDRVAGGAGPGMSTDEVMGLLRGDD